MFFDSACDQGTIRNDEDWDMLMAMFLKNRIVSIEDTKRLDKVKPSYPMTFETLLQTITQAFGDETVKELNSNIIENKEQLENCRTYINMLNIRSLSAAELY